MAATRDLNFSISAPVAGSKKFLSTTQWLMTDLTLIANCDKFVSKNLDVNGKKWVLEGPADKNLSFAALD
jgi:hypothetical protein